MAISLKHLFQSAKTDGPDNTIVQPSDWNDEHVLTQATGKLLGRTTAGTGATEEIAPGTGITLSAGTLSADVTSVAGRTGAVTLSTADISGLTTGYVQKTSATGSAYLPAGTTGQREGSPSAGYIRYNTTTGKFEGYGSAWGNIGGGAAIGDTPPSNPGAGDLWWNSADGRMYVYYTDANSSQWVDLSAGGAGQYLPLTGGTVTGALSVTGGIFSTNGVATLDNASQFKVLEFDHSGTRKGFVSYDNTNNWVTVTAEAASSQMLFQTGGGIERMRIDASGRVTKPYQPAFYARYSSGGTLTLADGQVFAFNTAEINVGSAYNTSTGRFTAPIAGVYYFHWSLISQSSGNTFDVRLWINGSNPDKYGGYSGDGWTGFKFSSNGYLISLSAGDYVELRSFNPSYILNGVMHNHFSGYLLG